MPLKSAAELIANNPRIEAGAPFVCLDEAAINNLYANALLHAAEVNRKIAETFSPVGIVRTQLIQAAEAIELEAAKLKEGKG